VNAAAKDAELYLRRCRQLEQVSADLLVALEGMVAIVSVLRFNGVPGVQVADSARVAIAKAKAVL
jgi:hypothetical protein